MPSDEQQRSKPQERPSGSSTGALQQERLQASPQTSLEVGSSSGGLPSKTSTDSVGVESSNRNLQARGLGLVSVPKPMSDEEWAQGLVEWDKEIQGLADQSLQRWSAMSKEEQEQRKKELFLRGYNQRRQRELQMQDEYFRISQSSLPSEQKLAQLQRQNLQGLQGLERAQPNLLKEWELRQDLVAQKDLAPTSTPS